MIDANSRILYTNRAYCDFLGRGPEEMKGRPLRDIRPGAILPNVLITKKPVFQAPRQETEDVYFVNMYPVFQKGEVVGGISIITFIQHAKGPQKLLGQIREYNRQIISRLSEAGNAQYTFDDIIAVSDTSKRAKKLAERAAKTDATVFLQSESGTGNS